MLLPRKVSVLAATVIALAAFPAASGAATKATTSEAALLVQINHVRAAYGLHSLAFDAALARAARAHTRAMVGSGTFSHGDFGTRMRQFHIAGQMMGENLAWGSGALGTAHAIVDSWLASPPHRANLLRPGFRRIGLGAIRTNFAGTPDANVVTADFAGV